MEINLTNGKSEKGEDVSITGVVNSVVIKKKFERKQMQLPQRKRKRSSSSSEDEIPSNLIIDEFMEKNLHEIAKKNNLKTIEMRKLLKNLVCNEHVLAYVDIEATTSKKEINSKNDFEMPPPSNDSNLADIMDSNTKLTRSKVKELNQGSFLGIPALSKPAALEPKVTTLMSAELHSDEDDEEYCPREEDFLSDDDPNTTVSDIDSQPRTPMTMTNNFESPESPTVYTSDGLFKIPAERCDTLVQDEIIAKRTRSKLSLEQTPIEIIQSKFHPPDSTQDLYETVLDQEWLEFLNDFNKPMNTSVVTDDDDPIADPEYIGGDKVPLDAEELRNVNISKKEINDLIAELFDSLVEDGIDLNDMSTIETPINQLDSSNGSPKRKKLKVSEVNKSTIETCSLILNNTLDHQIIESTNATQIVPNNESLSFISLPANCLQVGEQFNTEFITNNSLICIPESEVQMQTIESKRRTTKKSKPKNKPKDLTYELPDVREYVSIRQTLQQEYIQKFEELKCVDPSPNMDFNDTQIGMTPFQNLILHEQLRIHVQFIAQNFVQTYASPKFYRYGYTQKEMLMELLKQCQQLHLNVINLIPAVEFIENFEKELSEDNEKNSKLIKFINKQIERTEQKSTHSTNIMKFPSRIMNAVLNGNYVFLHPQYLPRIPFRTNAQENYQEFAPSESYIIAFELEKYMEEANLNGIRKKKNPVIWACERMAGRLITGKTGRRIYDFIKQSLKDKYYNPIKYYFDKKKAVRFSFNPPEEINVNELVPLKYNADNLPLIWKQFAVKSQLNPKETHSDDSDDEPEKPTYKEQGPLILVNYILQEKLIHTNGPIDSGALNTSIDPTYTTNTSNCINNNLCNSTQLSVNENNSLPNSEQPLKGQKLITDFFNQSNKAYPKVLEENCEQPQKNSLSKKLRNICKKRKQLKCTPKYLLRRLKKIHRVRKIKKLFRRNLFKYFYNVKKEIQRFKNKKIQHIYSRFYTLELYSSFLIELKMNCKRLKTNACEETSSGGGKRVKQTNDDEKTKSKKAHRQEECLKHMLLPDRKDEANKKDAIYAFNFYDKVEETLKSCNKMDEFRKFQNILISFNPLKDSAATLYNKLENIFLPENPELAEVLLTFLLPSEAAEIGKFFTHFMVTNAGTFINKLNIYFNKQPAQLKKIYNCLSELAEEPDITMDKIKTKIVPLLKGNQFLLEWFLQLFPSEKPTESLHNIIESVALKDIEINSSRISYENVPALDINDDGVEDASCQLKYINGRIYYGHKITLPAKLAFMAASDISSDDEEDNQVHECNGCVHGIRELAGKRLKTIFSEGSEDYKSDDEDDLKETELTNETHYEVCDDATLRAHAFRLNPSLYASVHFSNHHSSHQTTHTKYKLTEDCKLSPKKCYISKANNIATQNGASSNLKERRKSPKKTIMKSPNIGKVIVTHPSSNSTGSSISNAIATAKKLKSLVEDDELDNTSTLANNSINCTIFENSFSKSTEECFSARKEIISDSNKINKNLDLDDNDKENTESEENSENDENKVSGVECGDIVESTVTKRVVWKREEDKIILEEAKRGCENEDTLITRIHQKMSYRHKSDILDRHNFLLAVLSKLRT